VSDREYRLSDDGHVLALRESGCASCATLRALLAEREKEIQRLARAHIKSDDGWADADERVAALLEIIEQAPHSPTCQTGPNGFHVGTCDCWKSKARDGAA